ncbi:MAG: chemotaxis protein CheW [Pseudomonadales bacterium]
MADDPSDNHPKNQDQAHDEVQNYLDMMLAQATEPPEAQISRLPERVEQVEAKDHDRPLLAKVVLPLTMVGGTVVSTKSTLPKSMPRSRPLISKRSYAEPAKPLAFKMPTVKPKVEAPVVDESVKGKIKEPEPPAVAVPASEPAVVEPPPTLEKQQPEAELESSVKSIETTSWLENGRPSWAQQRFECLLFSVGELTLAVPLVELGTIYPISGDLTPIFGQIDWFMGLLQVKDNNIRTVNTAKVVMPERYSESMIDQFAYVISINGVDWGLAVDRVSNAITLEPDDVRWRGERSKRPWLAGTVVEHMCALLDVSQLAAMFLQQDG